MGWDNFSETQVQEDGERESKEAVSQVYDDVEIVTIPTKKDNCKSSVVKMKLRWKPHKYL